MPYGGRTSKLKQFLSENGPQSFPKLKGSKQDLNIFEKTVESDDDIYVDYNLKLLRLLSVERECFVSSQISKKSVLLKSFCSGLSPAKYPFLLKEQSELEQIVVEYVLNTNDFFLWGDKVYCCKNGKQKMPTISEYKDAFEIFTFLERNPWGDFHSNCTLKALREENKSWPSIMKRNSLFFAVDRTISWNEEAFTFDVSKDGKKLLESSKKESVRKASEYLCAEYLCRCLRIKFNGTATIDQLFSVLKSSTAPAQIYYCDITSPIALKNFLAKNLTSKIDFKKQSDKELILVRDNSKWEELCMDAVRRKTKESNSKAKKPDKQTVTDDFVALDKEEFLLFQQTQEAKKKAEKLAEKAPSRSEVEDESSWQNVAKRHTQVPVRNKAPSTSFKSKACIKSYQKQRTEHLPGFKKSQPNKTGFKSNSRPKTSFGNNHQRKKPTQAYQRQPSQGSSSVNFKTTYARNQQSKAATGIKSNQHGIAFDKRSPTKFQSLPEPFPEYKFRQTTDIQQATTKLDKLIPHSITTLRRSSDSDKSSREMKPAATASRPTVSMLNNHSSTGAGKNVKAAQVSTFDHGKNRYAGNDQDHTNTEQTKEVNAYTKGRSNLNDFTASTRLSGTNVAGQSCHSAPAITKPQPVSLYSPSIINFPLRGSVASGNEGQDTEQHATYNNFVSQSSASHFTENIIATPNPECFSDTASTSTDLKQMVPHPPENVIGSRAKVSVNDEKKSNKAVIPNQLVSEATHSNEGSTSPPINNKFDVIRSVLEKRGEKVHINILFLHCQIKKNYCFSGVQELITFIESENESLEMRDCWVDVKRTSSRPRALIPLPVTSA